MAVATDATLQLLANNVSGIDTSGLMTDATGQSIVTQLTNIKNSIDNIKTTPLYLTNRKTSAQAVTVQTGTHTVILELSITAGLWLITGTVVTPSITGASGYRQVYVTDSSTSTSALNTIITTQLANSNTLTATTIAGAYNANTSGTIYLKLRHNESNDITAYGVFNAVKVGDYVS